MEQIIERITRGQFWKFHGGVHPPEQKFLTNKKPIRNLVMPEQLIIPLQQHIGNAGKLNVTIGDYVLKGQPLTSSNLPMAVPIHAPTSGTISKIEKSVIAHPSGMQDLCVFLTPDGEDKWIKRSVCSDYKSLNNEVLIKKIADAGIAGMGGAGFPTHIKVNTADALEFLIINASECEPYITADDLLIREQAASVVDGIHILDKLLQPQKILIGIEDNKPEAIKTLQQVTQSFEHIHVCVLPTIYPSGGEKQLIQLLTGKELPSGVLPSKVGINVQNVATCFAVADAVINDTPLIKRVVTVSGQALGKPQNVWALLGTPIKHLLDNCGYTQSATQQVIMGGPMMGYTLPSTSVPVVKTTNCILAPSQAEIPMESREVECIRCGQCADACPAQLLPQELQWSAKAKDQEQLKALNLFDCIECGACAYVCPSQIPLVHYYRIAKSEIRQQQLADVKAEQAKARFEARKIRLEKEKKAREEKHRKAAEARKARMNSGTPAANSEKSAVAAALARMKAKKQGQQVENEAKDTTTPPSEKSQVSAAIARAKAKKLAAQKAKNEQLETPKSEQLDNSTSEKLAESSKKTEKTVGSSAQEDNKKSKVSAAVAKAKAKKLAKEKEATADPVTTKTAESTKNENIPEQREETDNKVDKKAAVASAVAKAKAKKLAKQSSERDAKVKPAESTENIVKKPDEKIVEKTPAKKDKKASIASAVAKAKAKKLAKDNETNSNSAESDTTNIDSTEEPNSIESLKKPVVDESTEKKKKISAAIAKAKAKKLAEAKNLEEQNQQAKEQPSSEDLTREASKKARIAAAVAKAKAKKQQQEST